VPKRLVTMCLGISVSRKQTRLNVLLNNPAESQFVSKANRFRAGRLRRVEEGLYNRAWHLEQDGRGII